MRLQPNSAYHSRMPNGIFPKTNGIKIQMKAHQLVTKRCLVPAYLIRIPAFIPFLVRTRAFMLHDTTSVKLPEIGLK